MNNKAQSLVIFVILLPVILMFCCYIIDMSLIISEKNRLDNINQVVKISYKKNPDLDIIALIKKNDKKIVNIKITNTNGLFISYQKDIKSVFGNVIGIKEYTVKSKIKLKE